VVAFFSPPLLKEAIELSSAPRLPSPAAAVGAGVAAIDGGAGAGGWGGPAGVEEGGGGGGAGAGQGGGGGAAAAVEAGEVGTEVKPEILSEKNAVSNDCSPPITDPFNLS
jgi:hypothetical protein